MHSVLFPTENLINSRNFSRLYKCIFVWQVRCLDLTLNIYHYQEQYSFCILKILYKWVVACKRIWMRQTRMHIMQYFVQILRSIKELVKCNRTYIFLSPTIMKNSAWTIIVNPTDQGLIIASWYKIYINKLLTILL